MAENGNQKDVRKGGGHEIALLESNRENCREVTPTGAVLTWRKGTSMRAYGQLTYCKDCSHEKYSVQTERGIWGGRTSVEAL